MTRAERDAFLADVHVGIISIARDGLAPLCVPIWYDYTPEAGLWVLTGRDSEKGRALQAAGRFSLCAQVEAAPYQYVSVEGLIEETRPSDLERDYRPMAHRYLGAEGGDLYTAETKEANALSLVFRMRPERWRTVDYRKLGAA
jgi:nitroimidazol reductase NimA-like FMN-containing flavoprotein (pyridoxamine 5'-phosphate oxidase superfamily)